MHPLKDLSPERPTTTLEALRERLCARGARALTDAELLALLIRTGDPDPVTVAKHLLEHMDNDLTRLWRQELSDLLRLDHMTVARAVPILAAMELGRRRRDVYPRMRTVVSTSQTAHELLQPVIGDLNHEEFWVLLLDRGNRLLKRLNVSRGGINGTVADPRIIFNAALAQHASGMIVAHNHPSGQLRPSAEDIALTRKLVEGGRFLDIAVQDHLIVSQSGYYSFADNGQLC